MSPLGIEPQLVYVFQPLELAALLAKVAKAAKEDKPRILGWRLVPDEGFFGGDNDDDRVFQTRAMARTARKFRAFPHSLKVVAIYE